MFAEREKRDHELLKSQRTVSTPYWVRSQVLVISLSFLKSVKQRESRDSKRVSVRRDILRYLETGSSYHS